MFGSHEKLNVFMLINFVTATALIVTTLLQYVKK